MKKIRSILSRYRLMTNVLALVFVLGTLAVPAAGDEFELIIECENGCIGWTQQHGCVNCQRCCVQGGVPNCWRIGNEYCS